MTSANILARLLAGIRSAQVTVWLLLPLKIALPLRRPGIVHSDDVIAQRRVDDPAVLDFQRCPENVGSCAVIS